MAYQALYRVWRSQRFDDVVGQKAITQTLKNAIVQKKTSHAYLFTGPRGTGKTSAAKIFAKAINCKHSQDGEPCNVCETCVAITEGRLNDVIEIDAASNNGVEEIRDIRDKAKYAPTQAEYKVYIIDEVHMLSTGAFNALLKTLEEPPKHVKFILATTEPQKLPATILSRCQRFDFKKIADKDITGNLKSICEECNIKYSEDALNLIAELSEGAMRDALSILERCMQSEENDITKEKVKDLVGIPKLEYISGILKSILAYDIDNSLEISNQIILEGKDLNNFLWEIIKYVKDLMILKTTQKTSNIYSKEDVKIMTELIATVKKDRLLNIIYTLSDLENELKCSSQKNIIFQVGIMRLCNKENMNISERVDELENKINTGNFTVNQKGQTNPKTNNANEISTNTSKKVENTVKKVIPKDIKSEEFWNNVIEKLKEERKAVLYSNLSNTKAELLDDMTVGIHFLNGLNSFGKAVIERPENINELKRLVSLECGKDMRIKIISEEHTVSEPKKQIDLGIDINYIDE